MTSDSTTDPTGGNNTSSPAANTLVHASADLSVTKSDGETTVQAGTPTVHTYTITVSNAGPSDAVERHGGRHVARRLHTGHVTPSQGTCSGAPNFTCSLGTIASGARPRSW